MTPGEGDHWFVPLGGCGEIGMNLNLFGHAGSWLMVDCGITFERPEGSAALRPSIQMPDPRFIASRRQRLAGLVLTHAHEDHLGAVPYLWRELRCPIYATPFTASVLREKNRSRGDTDITGALIEVRPGDTHQIGPFSVEWMPITHSTPETCALGITTPTCRILHTADWKLDTDPVVGAPFREAPFRCFAERGVDAVICDSTNALKPGRSPTERAVADGLLETVAPLQGRVVIACFASNVARMQSVLRLAHATQRRVGLLGRSLHTMFRCARASHLLDPRLQPIAAEHLGYLPEREVLALATGSQGEVGAALHRLMMDSHPHLSLAAGDTVILSSTTIPGNEMAVNRLVEGLTARGISVVQADAAPRVLHASGHPCEDELKDLFTLLSPHLVVPVHGEREHMVANARIARAAGARLALTGANGDLFYLSPNPGVRRQAADVGRLEWCEENRSLIPVTGA
ncbi:metallo-beta-lactamase family protein [Luminiphilus syltensis NOR5-1B]|uniref:Metallo-beta-lactamase family protein n=1 Tax=Luminiphilus syltensis NOR5-1B TaxID=565045 RepID=B8KTN4_9GAMM|nr:ribonuclease J [Luminiphilus syltensis]EED36497.1 metallo-beta-lactamase family protein [Luminiphilus syltensis NOR5-1B]